MGSYAHVGTANHAHTFAAVNFKLTFIRPEETGLWDLSTYGKVNRTEGTPYMNDDWTTGRIRFEGQPNFSDQLHVLMDLVKNELYVRLESGFIGNFLWNVWMKLKYTYLRYGYHGSPQLTRPFW
ncbi:MAG: hypothetical protein R2795_11565 [Saprospiraceae bacterium]